MTKIKTKQRTVPEQEPFDYASFESEAIKRLYEGDGLVGAQGILTNLIQRLVNAALSGEMVGHLKEQRQSGEANRRNGHTSKTAGAWCS